MKESHQLMKEKTMINSYASKMVSALKGHGVIVLGYSGWDDAIVEALAMCDCFDYRLYWCGLESDPSAKGAFGPRVHDILQKSTASYVQIESAGTFMAKLCGKLINGLPRLLANPVGQIGLYQWSYSSGQ